MSKKGALNVILCGVAVLQSYGFAVLILIQVRGEPQIQCLNPKGEFLERSSARALLAVKRILEWSKKYFEQRRAPFY
jgi:hypothetical protein